MNTFTLTQRRSRGRVYAALAILPLLLTAFTAAFFVAEAQELVESPEVIVQESMVGPPPTVDICHIPGAVEVLYGIPLPAVQAHVDHGDFVIAGDDDLALCLELIPPPGGECERLVGKHCPEPEPKVATIVAHKIECELESEVPNQADWNSLRPIDPNTAADWVASHDSCEFAAGWEFEWGPQSSPDPGDSATGTAGDPWTTFGPTDSDGMAETTVSAEEIGDDAHLWFREVLQDGYIPFTHDQNGNTNADEYSAAVFCATDVLNHDNYDRIDAIATEETYNCVAWNVPVEPEEPEYGPYCGDGDINQEWEQCDSGHLLDIEGPEQVGCSVQCQFVTAPVCTDLTLAKINIANVENLDGGVGDMTDDIYLGGNIPIPNQAWFMVHWNGVYADDADISGYEEVPGLAVERAAGELRSVMHGSNTRADEEHVEGMVEFWSWDGSVEATALRSDNSGNNKLEGDWTDGSGIGSTNAGDDEAWLDSGDAHFWLTTTSADDGFYTEYSDPAECAVCEPEVNLIENGGFEAPIVAASSYEIYYSGEPLLAWLTGDNGIEIQNNVAGSPYAGNQHAELDPHNPTMIWQEVPTIAGETYAFSTYYSPRAGREAEDNRFEFRVDGSPLGDSIARSGVGNQDTVWTLEEREFVATGPVTSVGFAEIGTDTSYGAYLDEVSLMCVPDPEPPVDVCENLDGIQETLPEGYEFVDEGICMPIEEPILGCTDEEALNYNPSAAPGNEDAEACEYEEEKRKSYSSGTRVSKPEPQVLGATTSFCPLLTDHMQMGWQNERLEVMKLQMFLNTFRNTYGGVENPVTGNFGVITDANVKAFQEQYHDEVITPWYERGIVSHHEPTGFVYKTTLWKINSIVCPDYAVLPSFEGEDLTSNVDLHVQPVSD